MHKVYNFLLFLFFYMDGIPFLVYAVTSIHVGMGRSSGVVDLPVQRDPAGFPVIFSSSFKGALKQFCGQLFNATNKEGRIDCNKASICCCLLGGEEENSDVTSIISFSDLYPLAIPVPSLDSGYVYLTSKYLINTVKDLFEAVNYKEGIDFLSKLDGGDKQKKVIVGIDYEVPLVTNISNNSFIQKMSELGSIASKLNEGIAVEDNDSKAVLEIERGIIKFTRNKINYSTGTVAEHSLWTEEYLPHGTIFAGIIFFNVPRRNKYCNSQNKICDINCAKEKFEEFLKKIKGESNNEFYLNVGGKESIGKGIIKVKFLSELKNGQM